MRYVVCAPHIAAVVAIIVLTGLATPFCRADLISFQFDNNRPFIQGINGTLSYDAGTGQFHAETEPISYTISSRPDPGIFSSGLTTIDLFVDTNGKFVSSGTGLSVTGSLDIDGDGIDDVSGGAMDPLLFGMVLNFGAEAAGPPTRAFNGLFDIAGGKLTGMITLSGGGTMDGGYPIGPIPGGFYIQAENVDSGTLGAFNADFSSSSVKDTIGVVTPEPATLVSGIIGSAVAAGFGLIRRRFRAGHGGSASSA